MSRRMGWAGNRVVTTSKVRNVHQTLVRKPEQKGSLGRHDHRLRDNIKINLEEIKSVKTWIKFIWLKIAFSGRLLWTQH
jgi:hypothetical protein